MFQISLNTINFSTWNGQVKLDKSQRILANVRKRVQTFSIRPKYHLLPFHKGSPGPQSIPPFTLETHRLLIKTKSVGGKTLHFPVPVSSFKRGNNTSREARIGMQWNTPVLIQNLSIFISALHQIELKTTYYAFKFNWISNLVYWSRYFFLSRIFWVLDLYCRRIRYSFEITRIFFRVAITPCCGFLYRLGTTKNLIT
jgi:hypothetical protein